MIKAAGYPVYQSRGLNIFLLIVLVTAVVAVAGQAIAAHADTKHGVEAETARQCLSSPNRHLFFNETTNRFGVVCSVKGVWGVVIQNAAKEEITAFLKNKMHTFEQVMKYMRNGGYQLVH